MSHVVLVMVGVVFAQPMWTCRSGIRARINILPRQWTRWSIFAIPFGFMRFTSAAGAGEAIPVVVGCH